MAKVEAPLLSLEARGQIGRSMIANRRNGKNIMRAYKTPSKTKSQAQILQREKFAAYRTEWNNIPQAYKDIIKTKAIAAGRVSGYHQYLHDNMQTLRRGQIYYTEKTVALYHLNEGEGSTIYDASGFDNNGVSTDGEWTDGKWGPAIYFCGVGCYVDCGSTPSINFGIDDFTVLAWVNPEDTASMRVVTVKYKTGQGGFQVRITSGNKLNGYIHDGINVIVSTVDGNNVQPGVESFITVVFDRDGNMTRYINGDQTGTEDSISTIGDISSDNPLYLTDGANPLVGKLDDIVYIRRALSAQEIKAIYNRSL